MDDELESYDIQYTHKGIYSKMYMRSINANIRNTSRNITVTLEDLDRITVLIEDNNDKSAVQSIWSGSYKMISDRLLKDLVPQVFLPLNDFETQLEGKFRNNSGEELIFFSPPHFSLQMNDIKTEGSYAILSWNDLQILEFNYLNNRGISTGQEFFKMEYNEEYTVDNIVRSLILTPGLFTVSGFHPSGEKNKGFEQIEIISQENSQ